MRLNIDKILIFELINFIIFHLVLFLIWDHQVFRFKPKRAASLCFTAFP